MPLTGDWVGFIHVIENVHKRVVVIDVSETHDALLVLINPRLVETSGNQVCEEGCLSVPGIYDKVRKMTGPEKRAAKKVGGDEAKWRSDQGVLDGVELGVGPRGPLGDCAAFAGDGDTATATRNIGDAFRFEDDGPSISASVNARCSTRYLGIQNR